MAARGPAWGDLRDWIDKGKFKEAAEALEIYPFDDVAQSAFYLPWAVLPLDEVKGVQLQRAYLGFEDSLFNFRRMCREAASFRAEDEEVEAALVRMDSALDALLLVAMA